MNFLKKHQKKVCKHEKVMKMVKMILFIIALTLVLLKWRSYPIGRIFTRSESSQTVTNNGSLGEFMSGVALTNIIMKHGTGIYHAKFCIKNHRLGLFINFCLHSKETDFGKPQKQIDYKFFLILATESNCAVQIGVALEKELSSFVHHDIELSHSLLKDATWYFCTEFNSICRDAYNSFFDSPYPDFNTADKENLAPNFEIRIDTNCGKLWFGDARKQLKLATLNLLDYGDTFTFCCCVYRLEQSVSVVDFEKL